jgi:murein DD-endopeptidase MepM/ murein hydrolase activator NlpD
VIKLSRRKNHKSKLKIVFAKYATLSEELRQLAERIFCKRKIIVISEKGISSIPVSSKSQGAVVMLVLLILLWISYSTGKYVTYEHVISQKDREIWNTNIANEGLQYQMADLHQNLAELNKYFENIKHLDQFSQAAKLPNKGGKVSSESKFASLLSGDKIKNNSANQGAEGVQEILANIRSKVVSRINDLENIIGMTGINLKKVAEKNVQLKIAMANSEHLRMAKSLGENNKGQGGPYYPADDAAKKMFNQEEFESEISYLMQLEKVINSMPLSTPLKTFSVSSGFGVRIDPIRNSPATHTGIDLSGEFKSKVYSSAPGVVVYADVDGAYGRLIRVDHGAGVESWYAHLERIFVGEGDVIKRGQLIGLQGNTGRSTGTHLHYEVRLNNQPVNPANFLEAGKYVF